MSRDKRLNRTQEADGSIPIRPAGAAEERR